MGKNRRVIVGYTQGKYNKKRVSQLGSYGGFMVRLFVCKEFVNQIDAGIGAIDENINLMNENSMKAQYIYIYALFESTLTETMRYYLSSFPEKINKSITVSKELLLSSPLTSVVELDVINSYIRSFSSDTLSNYIKFYLKTMEISVDVNDNQIKRISNLRNTIVHDNLKTSSMLPYVASKSIEKLKLNDLQKDTLYLKQLLSDIAGAVSDKYYKYTLEKVCRSIWEETFCTPLLKFDNVWVIDESSISVLSRATNASLGTLNIDDILFNNVSSFSLNICFLYLNKSESKNSYLESLLSSLINFSIFLESINCISGFIKLVELA